MRRAANAPLRGHGGESAGGMVIVAGDGQGMDMGNAARERGEIRLQILVRQHADDKV